MYKPRQYKTSRVLTAALLLSGLCASQAGTAAPSATGALNSVRKAADRDLPATAMRGTGIAGSFNANSMNSPQITLSLPDGRTITATRQRTAENKSQGRRSWVGTFADQPGSIVSISTYKGVTTGFVTYGAETWELMPARGGGHLLYRVDDRKLPTFEPEIFPPSYDKDVAGPSSVDADTTTATTGGYVYNLLVVYTPAARAAYGQATLESMIQNAVTTANQAYQNSNVHLTANLVGLQEISYVESGAMQTSLDAIVATTDGKMDSVHKLRDTLGADAVTLISQDSDSCGMANVMTTVSTAFAPYAFNVVKPSCLSQHSLAHEIGHNQGNRHDRANTTKVGAYPYSYGFARCVSDGTGFRTVMAYPCTGAARVAWFSNPNAYYNGYATGIAYESNPANSADNARSMNNTAATFAALRGVAGGSGGTVIATPPAAPSSLAASSIAYNSVTVRWSDNSSDETGFKLERSGDGVGYAEIATLGAGTTSFANNGVAASSNYFYRVRAYNSNGNSNYSNTLSVTTPAVPPPAPAPVSPPAAPTSVAALNDANGSATVRWGDGSTNETGFEVRREKYDSKRAVWGGLTTVGTVTSNLTSLVDMSGSGTFRYSVRAVNTGGASGLAGPASVTVTGGTSKGRGNR